MYRIRFHGRGGQGMKTASRMLGTAFFLAGFEVQDAPRYGAERRGAPIFAYVRADGSPINERGVIPQPDLVVVADDSLIAMAAAGVLTGLGPATPLLVCTDKPAAFHRQRHDLAGPVIVFTLPATNTSHAPLSSCCAAAAAALVGVLSARQVQDAVARELGGLAGDLLAENQQAAHTVFEQLQEHSGLVRGNAVPTLNRPQWLDLPLESAVVAAPIIHAPATSLQAPTGLWRTLRPRIDPASCIACGLCDTYCPEGAISLDATGTPRIDYDHCKGCLICLAQCPATAISAHPEQEETP
jgi:pyruvate ferredoxin oxidoreductase gamma subunit